MHLVSSVSYSTFGVSARFSGDTKQTIMKIIIGLCLLAVTICTVDANLNQLKSQLDKAKSTVDSSIRTLERLDSKTQSDTVMQAQNKLIEQLQNHNNFINPTIDAIRREVEAAKAEGKNAQPCYDDAVANLREISLTAKTGADQCLVTAKNTIKDRLSFIQDYLTTARQLNAQLNSIFPNCYSGNIMQMQTCIAIELGKANMVVRNLESSVNSADIAAKSASNNVVLQMFNCVSDIYSNTRPKITDVRLAAVRCIQASQ